MLITSMRALSRYNIVYIHTVAMCVQYFCVLLLLVLHLVKIYLDRNRTRTNGLHRQNYCIISNTVYYTKVIQDDIQEEIENKH